MVTQRQQMCLADIDHNHSSLDVDTRNLNTTESHSHTKGAIGDVTLVERISSAKGTETLVELPCRTSGETTSQ